MIHWDYIELVYCLTVVFCSTVKCCNNTTCYICQWSDCYHIPETNQLFDW